MANLSERLREAATSQANSARLLRLGARFHDATEQFDIRSRLFTEAATILDRLTVEGLAGEMVKVAWDERGLDLGLDTARALAVSLLTYITGETHD